MSSEINRNSLCPCGSGKKYKNCCEKKGILHNKKKQNKVALFVFGGIVLIAVVVVIAKLTDSSSSLEQSSVNELPLSTNSTLPAQPVSNTSLPVSSPGTPQPPGPVPPGKVWSTEHGHWHDLPTANAANGPTQKLTNTVTSPSTSPIFDITPGQLNSESQTQGQLTPQPPGPAPEGKVWSPEHGHWHNAPGLGQTGEPGKPIPQPPGPVPAGKVWSSEHGHWHDSPVDAKAIQVAPQKSDPK